MEAVKTAAVAYARENGGRFVEELKALLRIPSISTDPARVGDVRRAAEFCAEELRRIGMENVRLIETSEAESMVAGVAGPARVVPARIGHPLVYAEWLKKWDGPTVLCYGHYDVQPAEPLDEWKSPPFEPSERDGNIYARGAVDDKGQMWMHVKALESLMTAGKGELPVNVRVILEGEEEVGGEGIARFVREHGEQLKADVALVSDTEMFAPELPTLCVGLRGMIYTEIEVRGARTDLHSGMYGGAAPNPFVALAQIIAKLKDTDGRILIPGIYDRVQQPTADELKAWSALPFDEEEYREAEVGSGGVDGGAGVFCAGKDVGATYARCSRDAGWLYRSGGEDGDTGEGAGEGEPPAGSGYDAGGDLCADEGVCVAHCAEGGCGRGADDSLGRPDRGEHGQRIRPGGDGGDAGGVGEGDGLCTRGRVDPHCRRLCS